MSTEIKAYVKVNGQLLPLPGGSGGGGAGITVVTLTSNSRPDVLAAGAVLTVPTYVPGSNDLEVFWNGLHLVKGINYQEVDANSISFTSDVPTSVTLLAMVTTVSGGASQTTVMTSVDRDAVLPAGTEFGVPEHQVGSASGLQIYMNGLIAIQGLDYMDVSSESVSFTSDIPKDMQIFVIARR